MLQPLEIGNPFAVSVAKARQTPKPEVPNPPAANKPPTTAFIPLVRQPAQTNGAFDTLKAAVLKQVLDQQSGRSVRNAAPKPAAGSAPQAPETQAESIVAALTSQSAFSAQPIELPSRFSEFLFGGNAKTSRSATALGTMTGQDDWLQFPKLDASWKVLPTADFAQPDQYKPLELLV